VAIDFSVTGRSKDLVGPLTPAGVHGRAAGAVSPSPLGQVPKYATAAKGGQDLRRRLAGIQHTREGYGRQRAMGLDDMSRQFQAIRRRLPGQFNRRGMLDSGQFQRGLGSSYGDELRSAGRFELGHQQGLDQLAAQQWAAEQTYAQGRTGGALDKYARRAALAAQIRGA